MNLFIVSKKDNVYLTDKVALVGEEILQTVEVSFPVGRIGLLQIVDIFNEVFANFELRNHLKKENYDRFLQLSEKERGYIRQILSMDFAKFDDLATETKTILKDHYRRGIILADVLTMSEDEVCKIRNMGPKRIKELNEFIKRKNLTYDMPVFKIMIGE